MLYSAFWNAIDSMPSGRQFRAQITSVSGSSAGAIAGSAIACHVPGKVLKEQALHSGISDPFYYFRALAVYLRLKQSMYSSKKYLNVLNHLMAHSDKPALPMTVAVTDYQLQQQCVTYRSHEKHQLINATMASASIPFLFVPRLVSPHGLCTDGSVARDVFPVEAIKQALQTSSGRLIVINCLPWPGHRETPADQATPAFLRVQRLLTNYDTQLYTHGLERTFDFNIEPQLQYKDGIFDVRIDNRTGRAVQSPHGNLHVIFVAPTAHQFYQCGGAKVKASLHFKPRDTNIVCMQEVGHAMAVEFVTRFGDVVF